MTLIVVERIVSRREFGSIFAGRDETGALVRIKAGKDAIIGVPEVGEVWSVEGETEVTAWGRQIKATHALRSLPNGRLMVDYLSGSVVGIGPTRALRLWEHFADQLPEALDVGDIDLLASVMEPYRPVLGPRLAAAMVEAWKKQAGLGRLVEWLSAVGIGELRLAKKIYSLLGDDAPDRLAENPWCLVPLMSWTHVDELGLRLSREAGHPAPSRLDNRVVGAADSVMKDVIAEGSTAIMRSDFRTALSRKLGIRETEAGPALELAVHRHAAIVGCSDTLRAPGCAAMEERVVRRLDGMLRAPVPAVGHEADLDSLSPEQANAVRKILSTAFACLKGGAGVGKTHVTKEVCRVWAAAGGNLLLMAVAGKAALRLSRATGRLARTLFRTIAELDERTRIAEDLAGEPEAGERAKLEARQQGLAFADENTLAIVDESSMLDLASLYKLLDRLPSGCRLLMIGDECQLPPVSFGLAFHRIVRDANVTATLSTVRRQAEGSEIPAVAGMLRRREMPSFRLYDGSRHGIFLLPADSPTAIANNVVALRSELADAGDILAVTPVNEGPVGVAGLNRRLHEAHVERTGLQELRGPLGEMFSAGEPLLYRKNDYQRALWNGSTGIVRRIDRQRRQLTGMFEGEEHLFETDDMVDLSLGYALTCHRSQGSEATNVIVALPVSRLLDPSWLYTAVTRARSLAILVSRPETIEQALSRPYADQRRLVGLRWPLVV